jgi:hypothetical protein
MMYIYNSKLKGRIAVAATAFQILAREFVPGLLMDPQTLLIHKVIKHLVNLSS